MGSDKKIIGLAGSKGVGKSTYACQLAFDLYNKTSEDTDNLPNQECVRVMSFASPLKEMLGCIVHKDYINDKEKIIPHLGVNARHCLQSLGTEWGRNLNDLIWVNIAKHRISEEDASVIILDDVRFDNEAIMIKDLGGEVWNLTRDGIGGKDKHISEAGISNHLIDKHVDLNLTQPE